MQISITARPRATTTTKASLSGARSTPRATTTATTFARSPSLFSAPRCRQRRQPFPSSSPLAVAALGDDATGAWLDLAAFVTGSSGKKGGPFEELADAIGESLSFIFFGIFCLFSPRSRLSQLETFLLARAGSNSHTTQQKQARPPTSTSRAGTSISAT